MSKVFVLIAYTIYIIGILSAGPHVAVRSLFPAEMNVPHVARVAQRNYRWFYL